MSKQPTDVLGRPRRYHGNPRQRHWDRERILAKVAEWHEKHDEPPRSSDWDPNRIKQLADRLHQKAREWELRESAFRIGDWPSRRTVIEIFGTWNAMIEEAGFQPRAPGQGTARGVEPSPLLIPISHAVDRVFEAEDVNDHEGLIAALKNLEATARKLRLGLEKRES